MRSGSDQRKPSLERERLELPVSPPLTNHEPHSAAHSPLFEGMAQVQHPSRQKRKAPESQRPGITPQDSSSSTQSQRIALVEELSRHFVVRQTKVTRSRGRVLKMRDRLVGGLSSFRHHQRFLQESQQAFMNAIDEASTLHDPTSRRSQIRDLYEATHLDECVLDTTTKKLHEIENRLGGLENVLKKREEKLQLVAQKMLEITELGSGDEQVQTLDLDLASETSDGSMHTYQSSVTNTHPALLDYWDKKGEVRVMQERLANVEVEYQDARARRNFEEDQEKAQALTEEEFNLFWKNEMASTQDELEKARISFHGARQACISAGLVPYVGREPPAEDEYDEDAEPAASEAPVDHSLITITADHGNANTGYLASPHSPGFPATETSTMDRVSEWIQAPPGYPVDVPTEEIQEHALLPGQPDPLPHNAPLSFRDRVASWINGTLGKAPQTQNPPVEAGWRAATPQSMPSGEAVDDSGKPDRRTYMDVYLAQVDKRARVKWTDTRAYIPPQSVSDSYVVERLEYRI
ncbi:hypothetical protein K431DRAFT_283398 [Polychaeton citri CBS 116435]|uniref:Uncharacterized protein n=1 Tax=Polychaeton citri CBS 116435 TaxID=1314669 RepID=A0A9P4QBX0_9PEZI|nr:hypothetical protein K431DRAFT_283398 [Polychaeton citri CBS 116435]